MNVSAGTRKDAGKPFADGGEEENFPFSRAVGFFSCDLAWVSWYLKPLGAGATWCWHWHSFEQTVSWFRELIQPKVRGFLSSYFSLDSAAWARGSVAFVSVIVLASSMTQHKCCWGAAIHPVYVFQKLSFDKVLAWSRRLSVSWDSLGQLLECIS